jgi:hypothetical protein
LFEDVAEHGMTKQEIAQAVNNKFGYIAKITETWNNEHGDFTEDTIPEEWNYSENSIDLPGVTPYIEAHVNFGNNNTIGWYRTDEIIEDNESRRILEIQSDLFQRGQNEEQLVRKVTGIDEASKTLDDWFSRKDFFYNNDAYDVRKQYDGSEYYYKNGKEIRKKEFEFAKQEAEKGDILGDQNQNKFLQVLNTNNNWVTYFVNSIIQYSSLIGTKNMYFPKGYTSMKIQGHTPAEQRIEMMYGFIEATERAIQQIKDGTYDISRLSYGATLETEIVHKQKLIQKFYDKIAILKERGDQTKSFNFYEKTIPSVLKKLGFQVNETTDPYGNSWYHIELTKENDNEFYFQYQDDFGALDEEPIPEFNPDTTNNFLSYYKYKTDLLTRIESAYKSFKVLNKAQYGSEKYSNTTKEFQEAINKLRDEIEHLDVTDANNVFSDIKNELEYLDKVLTNLDTDTLKNQDIIDRINFLSEIITGRDTNNNISDKALIDGTGIPNFDTDIVTPITMLVTKLNKSYRQLTQDLLSKDIVYQSNKNSLTEESVEKLFENMEDINMMQQKFLGINSNNDSIVATLLNTTLQTNVQKAKEFSRPLTEKIKELDQKLHDKKINLDIFLDKDEHGTDTGNLVHKFSKKYFNALNSLYEYNKEFNTALSQDKGSAYNKIISWKKENVDMTDFRKLRYFKELYGDQNPDAFRYSDAEMDDYEKYLRAKLGKMYDNHIQEQEKKLMEYEDAKSNQEVKNDGKLDRWISANSPFIYLDNYESNKPYDKIAYKSGSNTYFTYNNSPYTEFSPKQFVDDIDTGESSATGFYNPNFNSVESDNDSFEYWQAISDIYSKHINPTYRSMGQNISTMSYAKFEKSFIEEIQQSKGVLDFLKNLYYSAIKELKQMWYEKGRYSDKQGIRTNYTDTSIKQINDFKQLYKLKSLTELKKIADEQGVSYSNLDELLKNKNDEQAKKKIIEQYKNDLVDRISRNQVLKNYSTDLTKTTLALSELASLHQARQNTELVSGLLFNFHKTLRDSKGKERFNSNSKLNSWIDRNIYNITAVSRGNTNDVLGKESKKDFWKYLSDTDKQLKKLIEDLKVNGEINADKFSYYIDGVLFSKSGNKYYTTVGTKTDQISKEDFEKGLEDYFNKKVSELGIRLTPSGLLLGLIKAGITKGLALNPVSGVFNRMEGLLTNMIRDNGGDFWTRGNLKYAKSFLAFSNITKYGKNIKLSVQTRKKQLQMQTYQNLMDELSLFQDKKNELDRKDKESKLHKFKEKLNMFAFAVDNPEFKNQSEIVLSMLMDVRIKDNSGNEYKFFDGSGFPAYIPGTLQLREEFKNDANQGWETFNINENPELNSFFVEKLRIEDTIKKTQGNYATLDSIQVLDTNWGKLMMMFMRWLPEHFNQRIGKRNTDIIQRRQNMLGRYSAVMGNPAALSVFGSIALGITTGPFGLIGGAFAGLIPFATRKMWGKYVGDDTNIENDIMSLKTTLGFMQEILVQSINFPIKSLYGKKNLDDIIKNKKLEESNLTPDQIAGLRSIAQEAGIMIGQLSIMLLLKALLYDKDDKDDDFRRQLHNFIDNQGNRSINSLLVWTRPDQQLQDYSKLALLRTIGDAVKFADMAWDYTTKSKGTGREFLAQSVKILPVPIPSSLTKGATESQIPFLDKKEYQNSQWFDDLIKGREWRAEQTIKNERKKFKEAYKQNIMDEYKAKGIDIDDELEKKIDKKVRKRMKEDDVARDKEETSVDALDRLDFNQATEDIQNDEANFIE